MKVDLYGWFPEENKKLLTKLIKEYDIKSVIEVGSFLGLSTVFFASLCDRVTAIDTFEGTNEHYMLQPEVSKRIPKMYEQFLFNLEKNGVRDKVEVLKMTSEQASKLDIQADLIYIDASHNYEDVKKDIEIWYPKAIKVLCGDDYNGGWIGVIKAVDEANFEVNKNQRVWYHIK